MCGRFGLTREERELAGEFSELNPTFDVRQLKPRYNRMPVILGRRSWGRWLDPDAGAGDVADLLAPCPEGWLTVRSVSTLVNNVANEGPALIDPPPSEPAGGTAQLDLWVE